MKHLNADKTMILFTMLVAGKGGADVSSFNEIKVTTGNVGKSTCLERNRGKLFQFCLKGDKADFKEWHLRVKILNISQMGALIKKV